MYYYDEGIARWMPQLPTARTINTVAQVNSGAIPGSVGTLPLTGGPSSGSQPNSTPVTGVTGSATRVAILNKNVEMKDGSQ